MALCHSAVARVYLLAGNSKPSPKSRTRVAAPLISPRLARFLLGRPAPAPVQHHSTSRLDPARRLNPGLHDSFSARIKIGLPGPARRTLHPGHSPTPRNRPHAHSPHPPHTYLPPRPAPQEGVDNIPSSAPEPLCDNCSRGAVCSNNELCAPLFRTAPLPAMVYEDEYGTEKSFGRESQSSHYYGESAYHRDGLGRRVLDSFKRDPNQNLTPKGSIGADGKVFDVESAAQNTASSPLARRLKGRHLQMIAIGGSIGTGLFVGSGQSLAEGGPAGVVIAYCMVGIMLYCTVHALGEMAVLFPVAGSFSAYSTRFLDPAWGFAMGWNYAMQWLVVLPLEIVAATYTVNYWNDNSVNNNAWVGIFLVLVVGINLFGVKGYGEAEFVFAILKITAVIGFIILGVIINIGGGPNGSYIGGKFWREPGAFNNGFKGLCSTFVNAAFAFSGTELVGLAAAETANPRKSLPTAVKQVFWRITLFYIVSLTVVGLLVPYNNERLLQKNNSADAVASPFVIAIQNAGIEGLPSVFNAVIMIAVLSVGNSSIYGSSRTLAALAEQHQAPKIFTYIDRQGRPLVSIAFASCLGLLAFLAGAEKHLQDAAFNWMLALSGLSAVFTWASICLAHIRFRKGWQLQGHTLDELAFRSQPGIIGSWIGFIFNMLVLIAQFWVAVAPVGYAGKTTSDRLTEFFTIYLALPIMLVFYLGYKFYYRTSVVRSYNMDLHTGIRELNLEQLIDEEREERKAWPRWKKIYKFFC
ncbi:amino acid permease [Corynespora cassiicola Philippines]|uniref:Amino acid permease n=1 Tax=Corynespora cassiicola Philippines TaxID=1448308 RepID=A0A2T2NJP1_CORCC|nr:amino acid permease [Corynespora cassiicola Philippines]